MGGHGGGVGLRCQAAVGRSPHLAARKSKKVVARVQKDTPQPTKDSVLSSDSSSRPLCGRDGDPGVQSPHRLPDLTGPGSPAPRSSKAPEATALSPVKRGWQQRPRVGRARPAHSRHLISEHYSPVLSCWLSLNGPQSVQLSLIQQSLRALGWK